MAYEDLSDVNVPINSGVPLSAVIRTPGTSSTAKPKSISLISQLSLLTHTMFSGLGQKNKTKTHQLTHLKDRPLPRAAGWLFGSLRGSSERNSFTLLVSPPLHLWTPGTQATIINKSLWANLHFWRFCTHDRSEYNFTCLAFLVPRLSKAELWLG